jgi:histidine phosphotransferase ChpT
MPILSPLLPGKLQTPTMTSSTDLAALLCSRLCHDLLSPVSALGNGLELLESEEDPEMRQHCLELVGRSAQASAAKLRFFRLAFGSPAGAGEDLPMDEPRAVLTALAGQDGKVSFDWAIEAEALPRVAVKVLLNLAAIGLDALVRGGTLAVGAEQGEDGTEIVVRAAGPRIAFGNDMGAALDGELGEDELSARTAPATLVRLLAQEQGGQVQYALSDGALIMGAVLPGA